MNGLCLFAGICGIELGLKSVIPDFRTVCYVENDRYAQGVIMSRIRSGELDDAPIWDDVRTFDGRPWRGCVDIITGGFPCQDISIAGKKSGIKQGTRSGLWYEFARIIGEILPAFAFVENVANITDFPHGHTVLCSLTEVGYNAEWCVVSAEEVGAWHLRERLFILANNNDLRCKRWPKIKGLQWEHSYPLWRNADSPETLWERPDIPQPTIWGSGNGVASRVDRVERLRNAVVPQQAAKAWEILYSRIA